MPRHPRPAAALPLLLVALALGALVLAAAQQRPPLPSSGRTVKVQTAKFPTLTGPCPRATRTLRVGRTAQYKSIMAAVAAATPFTKIVVAAGTYVEQPGWYKGAVEVAVDDLCITGAGPTRTRVVADLSADQARGLEITSNRVAVSGIGFVNFKAGVFLGSGKERTTQFNITLTKIAVEGRSDGFASGLTVYDDFRQLTPTTPVVEGLMMSQVDIRNVIMGVSCDFGPCHYWWLDRVSISCRGGEGWGADAFAVETGKQIVITSSTFSDPTADGIDVKGPDVVVVNATVRNVGTNGIKLWQGGDVLGATITGTGAEALAGSRPALYNYQRVVVSGVPRAGRSYLGAWGYGTTPTPTNPVRVWMTDCSFSGNPNSGGQFVPQGSELRLINNVFGDVGTRLIQYGQTGDVIYVMTDQAGLDEVVRREWGSGNRLAP